MYNPKTRYLKIKIKTLVAEARIIKSEEQALSREARKLYKKGIKPDLRYSLLCELSNVQDHRTGTVRWAARNNLLAYGFLRGRSYAQMEAYAETEPDWPAVAKIVSRFGGELGEWATWLIEAQIFYNSSVNKQRRAA